MYLRSYRAQNILFTECYGELYQNGSVKYKVTSTYVLPEGEHPRTSPPETQKHKHDICVHVADILGDTFTDLTVNFLKYDGNNSFEYELTAKHSVEVGAAKGNASIEPILLHKHIGDQLFDIEFSNALEKCI